MYKIFCKIEVWFLYRRVAMGLVPLKKNSNDAKRSWRKEKERSHM
jgi:hypothetical protein